MSLLQTKLFFRLKKKKGKVNSDSEKVIKNGPVYKPIYPDHIVIYSDVKDINGTFKINYFLGTCETRVFHLYLYDELI